VELFQNNFISFVTMTLNKKANKSKQCITTKIISRKLK